MLLLLIFAFLSGLVTIAAPCIWPLLPLILSSSNSTGKLKPLGITVGITSSFGLLTLTISYIVQIFSFDPSILRVFATVIIGLLGASMLIPKLNHILEGYLSKFTSLFGSSLNKDRQGFVGGLLTGFVLGIVWTPCAGPILATIATLAATTQVNAQIVFVTLSYLLGVSIPLFFFALLGQKILTTSSYLSKYTGILQKGFGAIMILTALSIATNYDKVIQSRLLDLFPSYSQYLTVLETNSLVTTELQKISKNDSSIGTDVNSGFDAAPELQGISQWFNVSNEAIPTIESLKGNVVLIDFWTYTCINCIRTLPHLTEWYSKYKDDGFIVLGIHSPEFEFEKNPDNVAKAISKYKIEYPVGLDNSFETWSAYNNRYWPAKYLIDASGNIRYVHFGEGKYEETEVMIRQLLKEKGSNVSTSFQTKQEQSSSSVRLSPETYFGSQRMLYLMKIGKAQQGEQQFTLLPSEDISLHKFSLGGTWQMNAEYSQPISNGVLRYRFSGKNVFMVAKGSSSTPATVKVLLDGQPVTDDQAGSDTKNGRIIVDEDRLYELINLTEGAGAHILELQFESEGILLYTFTFG